MRDRCQRRAALFLGFLCSCATSAPMPEPIGSSFAQPVPHALQGAGVDYRPSVDGRTLVEVLAEPDAQVELYDAKELVAHDTAPLVASVPAGGVYRVRVIGSDGRFREQELASQSGQIARARFAFLTPLAGPSPSDAEGVVGIAFYLFPVVKALLH